MVLFGQTTLRPLHSLEESMPTTFAPIFQAVLKLLKLMQVVPLSVGRIPVSPVKSLTLSIAHSEQQSISPHLQQQILLHGDSLMDSSHRAHQVPSAIHYILQVPSITRHSLPQEIRCTALILQALLQDSQLVPEATYSP